MDSELTPVEGTGRLDVLNVSWSALDSALGGDCGRRWKLLVGCCPEGGNCYRQLQPGGGGSRSFSGEAEILSLVRLLGMRCSGAGGGRDGGAP